ncbi:hypothetical protein Tco_1196758 [Tanacetum coccineum]
MLPYPRFTKLIMSHYMTVFPKISRRACDRYHNLENDVIIKSIFNSGKNKNIVGMRILDWMITEEMKLTENYRLYAEVLGIDVPTTQSQPIESTPGTQVLNKEAEDIVLQDTLQVSLAEQKSHEENKARENVEKVKEHLMDEEIEKLVEGSENVVENVAETVKENVDVSSSPSRNDDNQNILSTRLEPRSDKESPEVEITDVVPPVNVNDEEEETSVDDYELKRRVKGKEIEESRNTPSPKTIRSPRIHSNLISLDTNKLQELTETDPIPSSSIPSSSSP